MMLLARFDIEISNYFPQKLKSDLFQKWAPAFSTNNTLAKNTFPRKLFLKFASNFLPVF